MQTKDPQIISILADIKDEKLVETLNIVIKVVNKAKTPLTRQKILQIIEFYKRFNNSPTNLYQKEISDLVTLLLEK